MQIYPPRNQELCTLIQGFQTLYRTSDGQQVTCQMMFSLLQQYKITVISISYLNQTGKLLKMTSAIKPEIFLDPSTTLKVSKVYGKMYVW